MHPARFSFFLFSDFHERLDLILFYRILTLSDAQYPYLVNKEMIDLCFLCTLCLSNVTLK